MSFYRSGSETNHGAVGRATLLKKGSSVLSKGPPRFWGCVFVRKPLCFKLQRISSTAWNTKGACAERRNPWTCWWERGCSWNPSRHGTAFRVCTAHGSLGQAFFGGSSTFTPFTWQLNGADADATHGGYGSRRRWRWLAFGGAAGSSRVGGTQMPDLLNFTVPGNSIFATLSKAAEADVLDPNSFVIWAYFHTKLVLEGGYGCLTRTCFCPGHVGEFTKTMLKKLIGLLRHGSHNFSPQIGRICCEKNVCTLSILVRPWGHGCEIFAVQTFQKQSI